LIISFGSCLLEHLDNLINILRGYKNGRIGLVELFGFLMAWVIIFCLVLIFYSIDIFLILMLMLNDLLWYLILKVLKGMFFIFIFILSGLRYDINKLPRKLKRLLRRLSILWNLLLCINFYMNVGSQVTRPVTGLRLGLLKRRAMMNSGAVKITGNRNIVFDLSKVNHLFPIDLTDVKSSLPVFCHEIKYKGKTYLILVNGSTVNIDAF
jgi:hypothetical protein